MKNSKQTKRNKCNTKSVTTKTKQIEEQSMIVRIKRHKKG